MRRLWLGGTIALLAGVAVSCSSGSTKTNASSQTTTTAVTPTSVSSTATAAANAACSSPATGAAASSKGDVAPPGDIPDNQAYVAFVSPTGHYTIKVPEGWARADQGVATVFTDKLNTIRIETRATPAPPSVTSVEAQDVPALKAQSQCFEGGATTTTARTAGTAILVKYRTDAPADPVTGKVVHDDVER
ncbi:MAG: lipoprotein, partial [Acidimicrobiales bacterium]|nr:lipoprotein [Acidimicrobiales bacterium]